MTKTKSYSLESRGFDKVLIKENHGTYNSLVEVSVDFDTTTLKIKDYSYRMLSHETDRLARWIHNPEDYVSLQSLMNADKLIKKQILQIKRDVRNAKNHPAYAEMQTIAKANIKHFVADFEFHDCNKLGVMNTNQKFLWLVRECGTWLFTARDAWMEEILKGEFHKAYVWENGILCQIPWAEAKNVF